MYKVAVAGTFLSPVERSSTSWNDKLRISLAPASPERGLECPRYGRRDA